MEQICAAGGTAVASYASVATPEGGQAIVDTALDAFGTVDVVINNAGILRAAPIADATVDDLHLTVAVHLLGAFYVSQPAFRVMSERRYGRLVFTSSSAGLFGFETEAVYGAAKAGLIGLVNGFGIEGTPFGIRVNAVMPNAITRMADTIFPEAAERLAHATADGVSTVPAQMTFHDEPHDVTVLVTYLASEACDRTQHVYSVLGNRFARVFSGVTSGWQAPLGAVPTAEDVVADLAEIEDRTRYSIPHHIADEMRAAGEAVR